MQSCRKTRYQNKMQKKIHYKEKEKEKKEKNTKPPSSLMCLGRVFPLMLQMFYSVEVIPSSALWCMIKHHHLCLCLQENLPSLFSSFRNCASTYYLCSTDYWSSGWRNAISLLLEMNQFEMPEVFGKMLGNASSTENVFGFHTQHLLKETKRWHCVWLKKESVHHHH